MDSVKYRALDVPNNVDIRILNRAPPAPAAQRQVKKFNQKAFFLILFVIMLVTVVAKILLISYSSQIYGHRRPHYPKINETFDFCNEQTYDSRVVIDDQHFSFYNKMETIYFVTATVPRPYQIPLLIRLSHTLRLVPKIHWIVVDQNQECNAYLETVLRKSPLPFTLLTSHLEMPYKNFQYVANFRAALQYIRHKNITKGILYFSDDEHIFDLDIFKEIRTTKKFSMFPTALVGGLPILSPVVHNQKVVTILHSWIFKNRWPLDISGFAINLEYLFRYPNATFPYAYGEEGSDVLGALHISNDLIEPKADNCTEVLVWKVRSELVRAVRLPSVTAEEREKSNLKKLYVNLEKLGITTSNAKPISTPPTKESERSLGLMSKKLEDFASKGNETSRAEGDSTIESNVITNFKNPFKKAIATPMNIPTHEKDSKDLNNKTKPSHQNPKEKSNKSPLVANHHPSEKKTPPHSSVKAPENPKASHQHENEKAKDSGRGHPPAAPPSHEPKKHDLPSNPYEHYTSENEEENKESHPNNSEKKSNAKAPH